jgi:hypothetical protein
MIPGEPGRNWMMKRIGWPLAGVVGVALVLGAGAWFLALPAFVEKSIEGLVSRALPGQPFSCKVRRVSLAGADLADIVLGNPEQPALRIDSLRLDYSLRGLWARHVERLALGGVVVEGRWQDGRFVLAGFPENEAGAGVKAGEPGFSLPGTIGQLGIDSGLFRCGLDGRMAQLPFRLRLAQEKGLGSGAVLAPVTGSLKLYPDGRELAIDLKAGWTDRVLSFKVGTRDFPLASLATFLGADLAGHLQFAAEGRIGPSPGAVTFLDLQATIAQFALRTADGSWRLKGAGTEETPPFSLALAVADGKWDFNSTGFVVHGPVAVTVAELKGAGVIGPDGGSGAGSLGLGVQLAGREGEGIRAKSAFKSGFSPREGWFFTLNGAAEKAKKSNPPLACRAFSLELKKAPAAALTLAATISGLALRQASDQELLVPDLKVTAVLPEPAPGRAGRVELVVPELVGRDGQTELRLTGLSANLPLPRAVPEPGAAGQVKLARIMLNGQDLGGLQLTAAPQANGLLFTGSHHSKVLAGVAVQVQGQVDISPTKGLQASLRLAAPKQNFTAFNVGRFVEAGQEITLTGEFAMEVAGAFASDGTSGALNLRLDNTRLEIPKRGIGVEGLNLALAVPDLFQKRSLPAQPLTFATAKIGDLVLADGKFAFQIESLSSLLLESGSFAWCDGHVYSQALRLRPTSTDYELTLFCDRLRLAGILDQFGLQGAEGEGTLNGRIPISVVDGRVRFVDGFLYSSPGDGGNIRIGNVGLLTAGIPKDAPQYSQVDFAGEALKNFHYNWAKLTLRSEGEELLLLINLDGQPAQPLPFKYNSELGGLSRLAVGETGGIIHPIRLDLNLRLPFQQILEYGGGMQKLYKMTQ